MNADLDVVEETADWTYALPNELMSPRCPGRILANGSSPQIASLRMWIRARTGAARTQQHPRSSQAPATSSLSAMSRTNRSNREEIRRPSRIRQGSDGHRPL